jgi:hypothetical protein
MTVRATAVINRAAISGLVVREQAAARPMAQPHQAAG